jgi:aryl sulfotransferase
LPLPFSGLVGPPIPHFNEEEHSEGKLWDRWISEGWPTIEDESDGWPFWSFFENALTWWRYRHLPNILFIHFADLKTDLAGSLQEIANFLEIPLPNERIPDLLEKLSFSGLKDRAVAGQSIRVPDFMFQEGSKSFFHKGTNGRWNGVLTEKQLEQYESKASEKFSPDCKLWFEQGKSAVNPREV